MLDEAAGKFPVNLKDIEQLAWQAIKDKGHMFRRLETEIVRSGYFSTYCL